MGADSIYKEDLKNIKEWISKQPHLPQNIGNEFLKRFLHCSNNSLEKSKNLIDLFYTIRWQAPEIFGNRDPTDKTIKNIYKIIDLVPLPNLTKQNYKVFIYRLADFDADKFIFVDAVRAFFMTTDTRLVSEDQFPAGEVPIFDMNGFSLKHMTKFTLPILRKYMLYTQEAHPIKLRQIHVINTTPFLDRMMAIIKPLMKSEVGRMIHFHVPNSETLYEFVPKDLLPEEYGGKSGKIAEIKQEWIEKVMQKRDYFLDETKWKVDESKRPSENKNGKKHFEDLQGSFRSLSID